jgi:hypothetical protein
MTLLVLIARLMPRNPPRTLACGLVAALVGVTAGVVTTAARAETAILALPVAADPASRQISVTVDPGLTRTRDLPTEDLRAARRALFEDPATVAPDLLRALADRRDGLAALHYTRHLVATGGSDSDIAYYGAIAATTGRVWTLRDAVGAMLRLDPATEPRDRIAVYMNMLYPHAWAGNTLALDAIMQLNGEGRLFGPLSDSTRTRILEQAAANGDGRIEMQMALSLLRDPASRAASADQIRDYLTRAQATYHPGVRAMATALLVQLETPADTPLADSAAIDAAIGAALTGETE